MYSDQKNLKIIAVNGVDFKRVPIHKYTNTVLICPIRIFHSNISNLVGKLQVLYTGTEPAFQCFAERELWKQLSYLCQIMMM